jgi:hypothetical protein
MRESSVLAAVVGLLSVAFVGCSGPARSALGPEDALTAELGFVRGGNVTRGMIEARLGAPTATYEGGRIVSYMVFDDKGRLSLTYGGDCYAVMIEYASDAVVARHALIKSGSVRCRKE